MQSDRTYKQQHLDFIQGRHIPINMQLQNILLKLFKSAQHILSQQCLQALSLIVQEASTVQQKCIKCIQSALFLLLSQIQSLTQKNNISICHNDYQVLQQSLQKAQSQVRKHIRIQQQLKLYMDGLQQKNQILSKQLNLQQSKYLNLFQSVKSIDQQRKQLIRKLKKIQQKHKSLIDKQKLKGHKSAKIISQSINKQQNNYSLSVYKSKPNLTNHQHNNSTHSNNYHNSNINNLNIHNSNNHISNTHNNNSTNLSNHKHSRSKISDKSIDKQRKQLKISIDKKTSKIKQLDSLIQVNLSNDIHIKSKQQSIHNDYNNDQSFIPTEEDVRIFRQMTKTVQMKQAYKRPIRKVTKYKTQTQSGKQYKDIKYHHQQQPQNRQYRSVSMYK